MLGLVEKPKTKFLFLSSTSPESFETIGHEILAQKIILREFRVDLNISGKTSFHRELGVEIGSTVSNNFIIDDKPNACFFPLGLAHNNIWEHPADNGAGAYTCSTTQDNPNTPLTMSGNLEPSFYLRLYTENGTLIPSSELKYLRLQFELTGDF